MFDSLEDQQFPDFLSLAIPDQEDDEEKDDDDEKLPPAGDG